jgi:transposase InsO family protein
VFDRIKGHVAMLRKQNRAPKYMRFDNGKELINEKLEGLARSEGIIIKPTAPYSPSQNGVAERFNRTLLELARAMLYARNLPHFLWDEAVAHAAYLRNRAPTRALEGKTPYEAWFGKRPSVAHLREFGCDVWVLDESNPLL